MVRGVQQARGPLPTVEVQAHRDVTLTGERENISSESRDSN